MTNNKNHNSGEDNRKDRDDHQNNNDHDNRGNGRVQNPPNRTCTKPDCEISDCQSTHEYETGFAEGWYRARQSFWRDLMRRAYEAKYMADEMIKSSGQTVKSDELLAIEAAYKNAANLIARGHTLYPGALKDDEHMADQYVFDDGSTLRPDQLEQYHYVTKTNVDPYNHPEHNRNVHGRTYCDCTIFYH